MNHQNLLQFNLHRKYPITHNQKSPSPTLDDVMSSVKAVEPWKSMESSAAPAMAQLMARPLAATLKRYTIHHRHWGEAAKGEGGEREADDSIKEARLEQQKEQSAP